MKTKKRKKKIQKKPAKNYTILVFIVLLCVALVLIVLLGRFGATGQAVLDLEAESSIYWLLALGVIILIAGSILYTKESK